LKDKVFLEFGAKILIWFPNATNFKEIFWFIFFFKSFNFWISFNFILIHIYGIPSFLS